MHPHSPCIMRERLGDMMHAASGGDTIEVARLADVVRSRIARERKWWDQDGRACGG